MRIDPTKDALIVVDLQPDFMPGGPLAVSEGDRIAVPIGRLARRFSTVVATQDWHPEGHVSFARQGGPWPIHCLAGSRGAAVHGDLPDTLVTSYLRKGTRKDVDSYSAFCDDAGLATGLGGYLKERGVARLFVVGLARDYCVRATALDGAAAGFEVLVVDDLTRPVDPASRARVDGDFAAGQVALVDSAALS
ncbi:MAG: Nicotinamidase [Myxococcales bacterium]|nr:Nicotinamidase [Myxococcales bacterium]